MVDGLVEDVIVEFFSLQQRSICVSSRSACCSNFSWPLLLIRAKVLASMLGTLKQLHFKSISFDLFSRSKYCMWTLAMECSGEFHITWRSSICIFHCHSLRKQTNAITPLAFRSSERKIVCLWRLSFDDGVCLLHCLSFIHLIREIRGGELVVGMRRS